MNRCPIPTCDRGIGNNTLLCRRHWLTVPKELRQEVYSLATTDKGGTFHLLALADAVLWARGIARQDAETARRTAR